MVEEIKQEALRVRSQGLSVFSAKVDKTPAIRKQNRIVELRSKLQTTAEMEVDFSHPQVAGIAVNCGPVPNQDKDLECLDIDCTSLSKVFIDDLCKSLPELGEKLKGCVEKTPSDGLHIFYYVPLGKSKCRDIALMSSERSRHWLIESTARGATKKVAPPLIETKGAGGYVVGFLSKAISKVDGLIKSYEMVHGSVETIPMLTAAEHDFLLSFAATYDERSLKKFTSAHPEPIKQYEAEKRTAMDQWRAETPWNEILPDSYRVVEVGPEYYVCWHPDSSDHKTPNAVCGSKAGGLDRYWSFSPNDWRLPANTPLTKDYVFCASRGWTTGSKEWKTFYASIFAKYCPKVEPEPINIERIDEFFEESSKNKPRNKIKTKKFLDIIPDECIDFPGWINTYVDYCMRNALYPEKRIAAASALGMFSALVGRSVMGPGELKLNLYMVVLGLTANGKDYPRKLNARICMEIDEADLLMTKVGSREGLEEKVMQGPKFLMADEGAFDLEKMKSGDVRYTDVMGSLLELFTSNYIKRRARAGEDDDGNYIRYPFLSVMTSSTPEEYFKALSPKFIRSGFYNRLLIMQAAIRGRMNVNAMTMTEPIPEYLVETAAKLVAMNGNLIPGNARKVLTDMDIEKNQEESLNKIENDARILTLSEDALQYFQEEVWKNDDAYSEYQKRGDEEKAASCARLPEMALKVSCLWELSRDISATELSLEAIMAGMRFVKEVNSRQTANTVMISDTKFGEITDKLIKLIETSGVEIENGVHGVKMTEAKRFLRKSVHNGQSVDDAIRYLQDCGEIKVVRSKTGNSMYLIINDQSHAQSQPLAQQEAKG